MIFNKVFQKRQEEYLAVNLFPTSCNLALFSIGDSRCEVTNSIFYSFSEGESFTQVVGQFLEKVGAKTGLKVVFGLPSFWIEGEQVKPEFEKRLLATAENLKLTPVAFVSTTAAFGFYKFCQSSNLEKFYVLAIFDKKILAEKFENGEMIKFASYDFEDFESLPFAEVFEGGETQPVFIWATQDEFSKFATTLKKFFQEEKREEPEILVIDTQEFGKSLAYATAYDLGKLPKAADFEKPPPPHVTAETSQDFGFLKEKDVGQLEEIETSQIPQVKTQLKRPFLSLANLSLLLPLFFRKFGSSRTRLIASGALLILISLFAVFWFLPKATVELFVKSQDFSQDFTVLASPTVSAPDSQNLAIPAQVVETVKESNKKTVTSSKKKIGDAAAGQVTVFNKTATPKTFVTGTQIVGPQNLRFVFLEQVTVASRSASLEGITFGKSKVRVEAADIGEEGNLPAGTDFNFSDFDSSSYSAHSEEAFSGGQSKDINIVAEEDRQRLEQELLKELREQAKSELTQLALGKVLDDGAITEKAQKLEFDKAVGEEANILQLSARIVFTATVFSVSDVEAVIGAKLKETNFSESKNWQNSKIETQVLKVESDKTLRLQAKFEADLVPILNNQEIARQISGKSVDFAKNYLLAIPEVENVNIKLSPKLPGFLGRLPRAKSQIKIEVKAQKD